MRRLLRLSLGTILIILGISGLALPILQGWLFLALGALILSVDLPVFERVVRRLEEKVPLVKKPVESLRNFLKGTDKPENQA